MFWAEGIRVRVSVRNPVAADQPERRAKSQHASREGLRGIMSNKTDKGKKGRKIGRAARKPSHCRYTLQHRWITNKAKRIAKQKRFEAKKKLKKAERLKAA